MASAAASQRLQRRKQCLYDIFLIFLNRLHVKRNALVPFFSKALHSLFCYVDNVISCQQFSLNDRLENILFPFAEILLQKIYAGISALIK